MWLNIGGNILADFVRDKAELAKAGKLIRELGYGRRYDELADAEAALAGGSPKPMDMS